MKNLLLTLKYDGSNYHGWQVQNNAVSVQQVFQDAVEKIFGKRLDVKGCSRTDSGVHANNYCLTFATYMNIDCFGVISALNGVLPPDIAVIDCKVVSDDFHPRYCCKSKEYVYKIYNGKIRDPFLSKYAFFYKWHLDAEYLNEQAQQFVGTFDYSGFCSANSSVENTVRTVKSFKVYRNDDMVYFVVEADGFLYNMVRIMVGTLLFVNEGKIKKDALTDVILSKNRKKAGKTAPSCGLYLNKVNY